MPCLLIDLKPNDIISKNIIHPISKSIFLKEGTSLTREIIYSLKNLAMKPISNENGFGGLESIFIEVSEEIKNLDYLMDKLYQNVSEFELEMYGEDLINYTSAIVYSLSKQNNVIPKIFKRLDSRSLGKNLANHSLNVPIIGIGFGHYLGYNVKQLKHFALGAVFHDIGKYLVNGVLNLTEKDGKLTDEEMLKVSMHAQGGGEYLSKTQFSDISIYADEHHLPFYGKLHGKVPANKSRILQLADVYAALREYRPYLGRKSHNVAMKIMEDIHYNDLKKRGIIRSGKRINYNDYIKSLEFEIYGDTYFDDELYGHFKNWFNGKPLDFSIKLNK